VVGIVKSSASLRDAMPVTAAFIDQLRDAFGAEAINRQIKAGINGAETFFAAENGVEIGSRPASGVSINMREAAISSFARNVR